MATKFRCYSPRWNVLFFGSMELSYWSIGHIVVPCWRLYWADRPGAWVERRGRRWPIGPDHLVMIAPYTPLKSQADSAAVHFWVHFTGAPPYDFVTDWIGNRTISSAVTQELMEMTSLVATTVETSVLFGTRLASMISLGMSAVPEELLAAGSLDPRVSAALQHMRRDLGASVSDLAATQHVSTRSLNRLFVQSLGRSPKQVLSLLRLNHAEMQLLYSADSIETVAETCGFRDRYHFSRAFSRAHGIGPATYRARAAAI